MKKNYLDYIPCKNVSWSLSSENIVTLEIKNNGILKKLTQVILKKPKISYIHLDEFGSFIWENIDGKTSVFELGRSVIEKFGQKAAPLYVRLINFFEILKSYNFITWKL